MHRHMKMKALTVTSNLLTLVPFQVSKWLLLEPSCVCFLMQSNTDAKPLFDSRYSWPFWKTKNLQTRLHPSSSQSGCHTAFWLKVRATPLEMKHLHLWSSPLEMKCLHFWSSSLEMKHLHLWSSPLEMKHLHLRNSQPWRQTTFFVLTLNLDAKTTFLFFVCLKNNTLNPDAKPQFFPPLSEDATSTDKTTQLCTTFHKCISVFPPQCPQPPTPSIKKQKNLQQQRRAAPPTSVWNPWGKSSVKTLPH